MEYIIRLDKWLWAARFFKTRALAKKAIISGKVNNKGIKCKVGKNVKIGDEFTITQGFYKKTIIVLGVESNRKQYEEAKKLYKETEESVLDREKKQKEFFLSHASFQSKGKPDKKQRRKLQEFKNQI